VILSHKRAGRVTTHKVIAGAPVCVPKAQLKEYEQHHEKKTIVAHPDSVVGLPAKRQWVYEKFGDVLMLDDDSVGMFRLYRNAAEKQVALATAKEARQIAEQVESTAAQLGAYLWGFGAHAHPLTYHPSVPFRFGGYSPGGAIGIRAGSRLFWPETTTLPIDDYWICCLNMYYHRFAFYDCRFAFGFRDTYLGSGGMSEYRQGNAEKDATKYLKEYFGACIGKKAKYPQTVTKTQRNPGARRIVAPWPYI